MKLHEYQAKQLFLKYNLPVLPGIIIEDVKEVDKVFEKIPHGPWVVKAQVHAGGRGKAGGVCVAETKESVKQTIQKLIHKNLITPQTDTIGQPVNTILVEQKENLTRELYLSMLIDRSSQRLVYIASTKGGMDIEKVAEETPDQILRLIIDPMIGLRDYQARALGYQLKLEEDSIKIFTIIMRNLEKLFLEKDLSLIEINPLGINAKGAFICVDGKITVDDNALFRQIDLKAMEDSRQDNRQEKIAKESGLNYITLPGNIGCMVNGAGLAMATMDLIQLQGGEPANFLDVGGAVTQDRVSMAFEILASSKVQSILVNIFGGIVRCDLIAAGIIEAIKKKDLHIPVIVRLEGNASEDAKELLKKSGLNITSAYSLLEAAQCAVQAARDAS